MIKRTIAGLAKAECNACALFCIIALSSGLYWLAALIVPPIVMNDLVDGPLMAVSFVAGAQYLSWALFNCHRVIDRPYVLRTGICMAWLGNGCWRLSRFLYAQGIVRGPVGAHDQWRGFMIAIMLMAAMLHIMAIDMDGSRPRGSKVALAFGSAFVGFAGMLLLHRHELGG